jgi:hypothetical protein
MPPKTDEKEKKKKEKAIRADAIRADAISWLLHSIKIILGDESIRKYIILHYNPTLTHNLKKDIRTFDAFIKPGKTRADKNKEIEKYLKYAIKLKNDIVVFTATNVQQHDEDMETHFQSFIIDNENKKLYVIDPAFDKNGERFVGIYYAEVTHEVIKPFFEENDYEVNFVHLSKPAQTTTDDVFCQSWSLLILLNLLDEKNYEKDIEFNIPSKKIDKYEMLLEFYKTIFNHMPDLRENLKAEYDGTIINDSGFDEEEQDVLLSFNTYDLLTSMKKSDV